MNTKAYRLLTTQEKIDLCANCIYILDANILLDLLRMDYKLASKILDELSLLINQHRLKVPFHGFQEYLNHATETTVDLNSQTLELSNMVEKFTTLNTIAPMHLQYFIKEDVWTKYIEDINTYQKLFVDILAAQSKKFQEEGESSEMFTKIQDTFLPVLLSPIPKDAEDFLQFQAERRYKQGMPPGDCDRKKEDNAAGDYIIWHEILEFVKKEQCSIVFVTGDVKPDWLWIHDGKKIGPRYELRNEFYEVNPDGEFYIYGLDQFLRYCVTHGKFSEYELFLIEHRKAILSTLSNLEKKQGTSVVNNVQPNDSATEKNDNKEPTMAASADMSDVKIKN